MEEDVARTVQVVAGVIAVTVVAIAALAMQPSPDNQVIALVAATFTAILALLGVHYGIKIVNGSKD